MNKENIDSLFDLSEKLKNTVKTSAESGALGSVAGVRFTPFDLGDNNYDFKIFVSLKFDEKVKSSNKQSDVAVRSTRKIVSGLKRMGFNGVTLAIKHTDKDSATFIAEAKFKYEDKQGLGGR